MIRINARGAIITSIVAFLLVLLSVAQWKRNEIDAWRGAASNTDLANQDSRLEDVAEFKDDAVAPAVQDLTAANATLGVRSSRTNLRPNI